MSPVPSLVKRCFPALLACFWSAAAYAGPTITVTPQKPDAIYQPGEQIIWTVEVRADAETQIKEATYTLRKGGATVIDQGTLQFVSGTASIQTSMKEPGTILAEINVNVTGTGSEPIQALGGAAIAPEKIKPSSPCPQDFDAFWQDKLKELAKVPENVVLEKQESGKENDDYWKITMDNIRGTHIRGQLARPASGEKFPAMLVLQWAGIYPLNKTFVTDRASEGWLTLNIMAHDLPIDESKSYYDELSKNALKNYVAIGNDDREKCYFLRMFLACYRAVEYLANRPDWNGKILVATGPSQGGLQSLVAAALNPKVTDVLALVPAGCDNTGNAAGRKPGWPYWINNATGKDAGKVLETSRYFDGVNFAARVRCPALVGLGLIDTTSPPSGVFSAINQLRGPKEIVVMPTAPHRDLNNTHAAYMARANAWRAALLKGVSPPDDMKTGSGPNAN